MFVMMKGLDKHPFAFAHLISNHFFLLNFAYKHGLKSTHFRSSIKMG